MYMTQGVVAQEEKWVSFQLSMLLRQNDLAPVFPSPTPTFSLSLLSLLAHADLGFGISLGATLDTHGCVCSVFLPGIGSSLHSQ